MSERKQYMLMEVIGDGTRFNGKFDSFLCPYADWPVFVGELFDYSAGESDIYNIRFTVLEMTDDEHAAYCEQHGIEWE